jgi:hypothetical protein
MARLNRKLVLAPLAVLFASACAPRVGTTELRSAVMNATEDAPASAALRSGDPRRALSLADAAVSEAPDQPWPRYHRALALKSLGETDEAVTAYREAEERFPIGDPRGRQLAIYGRARALDDAGRCDEAKAAYDDHDSFLASLPPNVVATFRPEPADWELAYGAQCQEAQPAAGGPAMSRVVTALGAGEDEGKARSASRSASRLPAARAAGSTTTAAPRSRVSDGPTRQSRRSPPPSAASKATRLRGTQRCTGAPVPSTPPGGARRRAASMKRTRTSSAERARPARRRSLSLPIAGLPSATAPPGRTGRRLDDGLSGHSPMSFAT